MDILIPEVLSKGKLKYSKGYELTRLSAMRVGGESDYVAYPGSLKELLWIVRACNTLNIRYFLIGAGTNTLFLTDEFKGLIISTRNINYIGFDGELFYAECGAMLGNLLRFAAKRGFGGAEGLYHIPGTVGGALRSNAGAFGHQLEDILVDADLYLPEFDKTVTYGNKSLRLAYRDSLIKHSDAVVMSLRFRLKPRAEDDIISDVKAFGKRRLDTQPRGVSSLGSVFKRVDSVSAGYYIEKCGLKGYTVGGASVSQKHAGFIVNHGNARWQEVEELLCVIESSVYRAFGIVLDKEIEVVR